MYIGPSFWELILKYALCVFAFYVWYSIFFFFSLKLGMKEEPIIYKTVIKKFRIFSLFLFLVPSIILFLIYINNFSLFDSILEMVKPKPFDSESFIRWVAFPLILTLAVYLGVYAMGTHSFSEFKANLQEFSFKTHLLLLYGCLPVGLLICFLMSFDFSIFSLIIIIGLIGLIPTIFLTGGL